MGRMGERERIQDRKDGKEHPEKVDQADSMPFALGFLTMFFSRPQTTQCANKKIQ